MAQIFSFPSTLRTAMFVGRCDMALTKRKTIEELNAEVDRLDAERLVAIQKLQAAAKVRDRRVIEDHLDYWGRNQQHYDAALARAAATNLPVHVCLNEARAEANRQIRDTQTALAEGLDLTIPA